MNIYEVKYKAVGLRLQTHCHKITVYANKIDEALDNAYKILYEEVKKHYLSFRIHSIIQTN